jgi:aromatic amino acid transport protein AroP
MLFGLAKQGNGPKVLLKTNKSGVPLVALSVSAIATLLCVLINYLMPGKAFGLLMALVVSALVINWAMISLAHLKFRKAKVAEGIQPKFKAFWYPFGNYLCLAFMAGILVIMYMTPDFRISVELIPAWLVVLGIGFIIKRKGQAQTKAAVNLG